MYWKNRKLRVVVSVVLTRVPVFDAAKGLLQIRSVARLRTPHSSLSLPAVTWGLLKTVSSFHYAMMPLQHYYDTSLNVCDAIMDCRLKQIN